MNAAGWKGEGDGGEVGDKPRFGRKGRRWLARCIKEKLQEMKTKENGPARDGMEWDTDALVQWFMQKPRRFVKWENADEYRGKSYTTGAWVVVWDKVNKTIPTAISEAENEPIESLDDWLRADLEGTLISAIDGGAHNLPGKLRRQLAQSARARRMLIPLVCVDCRVEFPRRKGYPKRCPKCAHQARNAGSSS